MKTKPPKSVNLGVRGETAAVGDHIAYFWESRQDFEAGVGFLELGLREGDHCVIFGHEEANAEVLDLLRRRGVDADRLQQSGKLSVLGGSETGDAMLSGIGAVFGQAVDAGAPMIRLLGNIGWGKPGWPGESDILAFEAKVTGAAAAFPCVVMCMYDVQALPGRVMVHGAFETHPLTFCRNLLRENPHHVPVEEFLASLPGKAVDAA